MGNADHKIHPDDETRELLRVAKRVSRQTGMPVKTLTSSIAKLIVAEQLRLEAVEESGRAAGQGSNDGPT